MYESPSLEVLTQLRADGGINLSEIYVGSPSFEKFPPATVRVVEWVWSIFLQVYNSQRDILNQQRRYIQRIPGMYVCTQYTQPMNEIYSDMIVFSEMYEQ